MNLQELKVSLFANHHSYTNSLVKLSQIVNLIRYDKIIAANTESYRKTLKVMGKKQADTHIKTQLQPAFGVAVTFSGIGHSAAQASQWTGLAMCDIDHFESVEELEAAVERLSKDPHVLLMYRSIGGLGLHIIYWYEREAGKRIDDTSWRGAFIKGNEYLAAIAQHPYDKANSDFTRLSGLAGDPDVYYNAQAEPFVITDDMIVEQNCEHQEHGRPRKVYDSRTFEVKADEAWQHIEQQLSQKQLRYEPGHHHDYILHAAYLFNRYGVPLDDAIKFADIEWRDHPKKERDRAIRYCYKKEGQYGTWRLQGAEKTRNKTLITLPEIRQWLSERIVCCYNILTNCLLWCSKDDIPEAAEGDDADLLSALPPLTSDKWQPVDDMEINSRMYQITLDTGKHIEDKYLKAVYKSDFALKVHPVRQYMKLLPEWDGKDRVKELSDHIHVVSADPNMTDKEAQESMHWAFYKWLVAMVGTWLDDNVMNQCIFTLIGPQGKFKTEFFRHLLPPQLRTYFMENRTNSVSQKDDRIAMQEHCMIELEEVAGFEGLELSKLKALVTADKIKERPIYGRTREEKPRLASLCASTNEQQILTDATGNRRWLCFMISEIDSPFEWTIDYEQLYAQLQKEYYDGFKYYFSKADEKRVMKLNKPFRVISPEEQMIVIRLRKPKKNEKFQYMSSEMINQFLNYGRHNHHFSHRKIGDIMTNLEFECIHKRTGNYFKVVEIPLDQQQIYIASEDFDFEFEEADDDEAAEYQQLGLSL